MFPGDFTVNGQYVHTITDNVAGVKEEDYLFNSTAEGYLASSDFVLIQYRRLSTTISSGGIDIVIDCQGDAGSGTQATSGNTAPNDCLWVVAEGNTMALPASLFAANSTRTGRIKALDNAGVVGTPIDHNVFFTFCSITNPSSNAFDPGDFTVDGGVILVGNGTANTNSVHLFDSTADGYVNAADFCIAQATDLDGNNAVTAVFGGRFSCAGDSGTATLPTTAGTRGAQDSTFFATSNNPLILPASQFLTGQSTRTVVTKSPVASPHYILNFCSWAL